MEAAAAVAAAGTGTSTSGGSNAQLPMRLILILTVVLIVILLRTAGIRAGPTVQRRDANRPRIGGNRRDAGPTAIAAGAAVAYSIPHGLGAGTPRKSLGVGPEVLDAGAPGKDEVGHEAEEGGGAEEAKGGRIDAQRSQDHFVLGGGGGGGCRGDGATTAAGVVCGCR